MLLLFTHSLDGSADILVERSEARGLPAFRFNTDLFAGYALTVSSAGFRVEDRVGRVITLADTTAALWRKPWIGGGDPTLAYPEPERRWVDEQLRAVVHELAAGCRRAGKLRLVRPGADRLANKLTQMTAAAPYLNVPAWSYTMGVTPAPGRRVVKALTAELIHEERLRFLFTTEVEASHLDPRYPWLVQQPAAGSHDATVVFVHGDMYGFRIERARDRGPTDWREHINTPSQDKWSTMSIPPDVAAGITSLMADLGLHYGRLDFIVDEQGNFEFLEVNSNGQFGWLDDPTTWWLHDRVLSAVLDPATTIR